jgi:hypothetical protein
MSSKLIKSGNVVLTDDRIIGTIRILESGAIQCECPTLHPALLIKHLQNLIVDIQFACFKPADVSSMAPPII